MGSITNNFSYSDFKPNGESDLWVPCSDYQTLLVRTLAENLEGTITRMPYGCGIKILKAKVEPDSSQIVNTSDADHLFGDAECTSDILRKKVGPVYHFSVGAADIIPVNMEMLKFYKFIVDLTIRCRVRFGKITLEYGGDVPHIHVSNDMYEIFGPFVSTFMRSEKFTYTTDGGVTYHTYQTDNRKCKDIIKIGDLDD